MVSDIYVSYGGSGEGFECCYGSLVWWWGRGLEFEEEWERIFFRGLWCCSWGF